MEAIKTLVVSSKGQEEGQSTLLQLLLVAMRDVSKWVRQAAKLTLGYVLGVVTPSLIPENVLQMFADLPQAEEETDDYEIASVCAFTFPAVVQNCGMASWESLSSCYASLFSIPSVSVLQSLAASFGEIATMIGQDKTEESIVPRVKELLNSDKTDVVMAVMRSLEKLLPVVKEESWEELVKVSGLLLLLLLIMIMMMIMLLLLLLLILLLLSMSMGMIHE